MLVEFDDVDDARWLELVSREALRRNVSKIPSSTWEFCSATVVDDADESPLVTPEMVSCVLEKDHPPPHVGLVERLHRWW